MMKSESAKGAVGEYGTLPEVLPRIERDVAQPNTNYQSKNLVSSEHTATDVTDVSPVYYLYYLLNCYSRLTQYNITTKLRMFATLHNAAKV